MRNTTMNNIREVQFALELGMSIISTAKNVLKNNNTLGATARFSFQGKKFKLKLEVEEAK